MALIEGIGDDFITFLFIVFIIVIVIISWLSTNVRELSFPANLLVIERRSRRLYTTADLNQLASNANSNNNNNRSNSPNSSIRSSTTTTTTTTLHHRTSTVTTRTTVTRSSTINNNENNGQNRVESPNNRSNHITSLSLDRSHELELVNEIVEQALVDNLLDGEFYSTNDIELLNTANTNNVNSLPQPTRLDTNNIDMNDLDNHNGIQSSNGEVASSINTK
jgi:hypothetical protein